MNNKASPRKRIRRLIINWAVPVGCGLFFLFLLSFVFFIGYVPTTSMEPVIREDSFIIGTRVYGELRRGDVIVFTREGSLLVKRIAGMPGEMVIAGNESLVVPSGCYFVLGDNPEDSFDSRQWEDPFIPLACVIAKVLTAK